MMSLMETKNAEEFRVCEYCKTLLHRREQAIELQTVQPIIAQFYDRLREYIQEGSILRYGTDSTLEYLHRQLVWNLIYIILRGNFSKNQTLWKLEKKNFRI